MCCALLNYLAEVMLLLLMENTDPKSWSSAHIYQSQWLQTTISDLDEKLEAMKTILDGDNSLKQEHMHCKWREDLIQMLEEFGQSYRVLAISYNQLKFKTSHGTFHSGSLSSSGSSKTICAICNKRATCNLEDKKLKEGLNHHRPKYSSEHSDIIVDSSDLDFELLNNKGDPQIEDRMTKLSTTENVFMKTNDDSELIQRIGDPSVMNFKFDNMWLTLKYQITKLTEDTLHQLVMLVQRNDEKRETIRRLQLEVETLKRENKALQISLSHSNADLESNQQQITRAGGRSMGKLFRGSSP